MILLNFVQECGDVFFIPATSLQRCRDCRVMALIDLGHMPG
jgi:hypothetical protein